VDITPVPGRRLLGQGEVVPPSVYLDLGAAFLAGFGTPTTSIAFTPVGGISGQNDDTTNAQRGLAAVGYTALDLLKDQAKRPPTVRLFAGTGIGILFQTDVFPLPQGRG